MSFIKILNNFSNNNLIIENQPKKLNDITQHYLKKFPQKNAKIIIAEADPLHFLGSFSAAMIKNYAIFLGNPFWQETEWEQVLNLTQPNLIIKNQQIREYSPTLTNKFNSKIMIPTGGSSGKIRFAIHTWETLTASVRGFCQYFDLKIVNSFCILPLYHVSGLMQFVRSLITGGTLFIYPYKSLKTEKMINLNHEGFFTSLVPTQLQLLLELNRGAWLAKFQTILLGGAPAWPELLQQARVNNLPLAPTYGMTETASQIVTLKSQDFLQNNNSSGQVLPHSQVKIIDNKGEELPNTQTGIITIKADSLFLGYYPDLCYNNKQFQTDDLGYFDQQGYLYLTGRNSQKIITGGENVFPAEIEAVILATKLVEDVCVIGIPDPQWGQAVTAVYVAKINGLTTEKIKQTIADKLSNFKIPKYWLKLEQIPRNYQGKINYQQLKQCVIEDLAKQTY